MEDENSFDPSEFFRHSTLASQAAAAEQSQADEVQSTDLNNDLEVSDSDDDSVKSQNFAQVAGIANKNEDSDEGFDIDEFLQ